jgi:hypothetical protein
MAGTSGHAVAEVVVDMLRQHRHARGLNQERVAVRAGQSTRGTPVTERGPADPRHATQDQLVGRWSSRAISA